MLLTGLITGVSKGKEISEEIHLASPIHVPSRGDS